ncbi:MAG TPA: hypothetical protein VG276_16375 [Actinomycetes bacterium]|jgi:hypothetical protein|nr:hypothetical protein [Actinomycetes bacterium]
MTNSPITIHLASDESNGQLAVIEEEVAADFPGSPLHVHPGFDEAFYVLDGN